MSLRLMIYDRTCRGRGPLPGLSHTWWLGGALYAALGRFHSWHGAESWDEALTWLAELRPDQSIEEVQFWGHGKWGLARIGAEPLDGDATKPDHPLASPLAAVRERLIPEQSLWWFRTCETFGAIPGQEFARRWSDFLGCRAAGHTYIIGHMQSGLHTLAPGGEISWAAGEGLLEGSVEEPARARWSRWSAPNTITCLRGSIPADY